MKDLSKRDEQKALTALESAIELVGEGTSPDEAITKVAQDNKLTAQMTQRMIEAYNISKTLHHLQHEGGEKRASTFPIADPVAILGALFPKDPVTEQKQAAAELHPDYMLGGTSVDFMKEAEVELPPMTDKEVLPYERDPAAFAKRAFDRRNKLIVWQKRAAAEARRCYFSMLSAVDAAADYWRKIGPKESFPLAEKRAAATYGNMGKSLMELIYVQGGLDDRRLNIKRASADELGTQQMMFDETVEPYSHVAAAVVEAQKVALWSKAAGERQRRVHSHAIDSIDVLPAPEVVAAL